MKIGIASFYHETNTFAPEHNDSIDSVHMELGEALLRHAQSKSFMGGFAEGAKRAGMQLVPTIGVTFSRGGPIHASVFLRCRDMIVDALKGAGPLDAIYFAFHGAMVAEEPYLDAEGELVQEVRQALGDIPVVGTYDFHAIMSDKEVELVVPFPNDTNPHIDG